MHSSFLFAVIPAFMAQKIGHISYKKSHFIRKDD